MALLSEVIVTWVVMELCSMFNVYYTFSHNHSNSKCGECSCGNYCILRFQTQVLYGIYVVYLYRAIVEFYVVNG